MERLEVREKKLEEHVVFFSAERIMESTKLLQFYCSFQLKRLFMACSVFCWGLPNLCSLGRLAERVWMVIAMEPREVHQAR